MAQDVYCTLFDSAYLTRGLSLHESLVKHGGDFHLFIYAMDDIALEALGKLSLDRCTVQSIHDLGDPVLERLEAERARAEFCWTCTPFVIEDVLVRHQKESCTYLDADICFFGPPRDLLSELGSKSVLITEHRYTPAHDQTSTSGIYCVQFITFKNDPDGRAVLGFWRDACIEACELNPEKGLCGDQKYLDDWADRYPCVHVLQHLGGGVAPWNVQQYDFSVDPDNTLLGREKNSGNVFPAIFYHFHGLRILPDDRAQLTGPRYELTRDVVQWIYKPYLSALRRAQAGLEATGYERNGHGVAAVPPSKVPSAIRGIRRTLRDSYRGLFHNNFNAITRF